MNYELKTVNEFRAVGLKRNFKFLNGENFTLIPKMWEEIMQNGMFNKIMAMCNKEPFGTLGICCNFTETGFDYMIGVATDMDIPADMSELTIKKQEYAVFTCAISNIQETFKEVMGNWLPNSEYNHGDGPEFELYPEGDICHIYIPIIKK